MSNVIGVSSSKTQDENCRVYHSRYRLTAVGAVVAQKGMVPADDSDDSIGVGIVQTLLDIPGVSGIQVTAYTAAIVKAPLYQWTEVEPPIMWLLTSLNLALEGSRVDEGRTEVKVVKKESDMAVGEDLGNGFRLVTQKGAGDRVRLVIKDADGNITLRGGVTTEAGLAAERMAIMLKFLELQPSPTDGGDPSFDDEEDE